MTGNSRNWEVALGMKQRQSGIRTWEEDGGKVWISLLFISLRDGGDPRCFQKLGRPEELQWSVLGIRLLNHGLFSVLRI